MPGKQPLSCFVFVAGIDGTADLFRTFEPRLNDIGFDVLYYEHTHIHSWHHCTDMTVFAQEIAAMLDAQGIEKAVICGESFGGPIAMTFAQMYSGRVAALVFLASFAQLPFPRRAWLARKFGKALTQLAGWLPDTTVRTARRIYNPSAGRHEPAEFRRLLRTKRTAGVQVYTFKSCLALAFDAREWLPRIAVPTLVLTGERDRLITPQCSHEIAQLLPNARLATIPNSGHLSQYAHPGKFWDEMEPFLKQVQAEQSAST